MTYSLCWWSFESTMSMIRCPKKTNTNSLIRILMHPPKQVVFTPPSLLKSSWIWWPSISYDLTTELNLQLVIFKTLDIFLIFWLVIVFLILLNIRIYASLCICFLVYVIVLFLIIFKVMILIRLRNIFSFLINYSLRLLFFVGIYDLRLIWSIFMLNI